MRLSTRRRAGAALLALALVSACSDDGSVGQGAARVGTDDGGDSAPLTTRATTATTTATTAVSDAAARDLATRALARVLGDTAPSRVPATVMNTAITRAKGGMGYDALVEITLRDYVNEAYHRIFRYRNDPAYTPASFAVRFDETVFQRLLAVVRGTTPRGSLALPDGRTVPADAEGIWSYVAEAAPVWGSRHRGQPDAENCVGGLGPRCKGTSGTGSPTPRPANVDHFTRMDGVPMNYIEMAAAVGSIMHDRSCADKSATVYVVYCNGERAPDPNDPGVQRAESAMAPEGLVKGELEWRKAAYNLRDSRFWLFRFGPYPVDGSTDPAASTSFTSGMRAGSPADHFADDTRLVAGRASMGSATHHGQWDTPYQREEFAQTTVLFAAPGRSLDPMDGRFCNNGKGGFATTHDNGLTRWGVC